MHPMAAMGALAGAMLTNGLFVLEALSTVIIFGLLGGEMFILLIEGKILIVMSSVFFALGALKGDGMSLGEQAGIRGVAGKTIKLSFSIFSLYLIIPIFLAMFAIEIANNSGGFVATVTTAISGLATNLFLIYILPKLMGFLGGGGHVSDFHGLATAGAGMLAGVAVGAATGGVSAAAMGAGTLAKGLKAGQGMGAVSEAMGNIGKGAFRGAKHGGGHGAKAGNLSSLPGALFKSAQDGHSEGKHGFHKDHEEMRRGGAEDKAHSAAVSAAKAAGLSDTTSAAIGAKAKSAAGAAHAADAESRDKAGRLTTTPQTQAAAAHKAGAETAERLIQAEIQKQAAAKEKAPPQSRIVGTDGKPITFGGEDEKPA